MQRVHIKCIKQGIFLLKNLLQINGARKWLRDEILKINQEPKQETDLWEERMISWCKKKFLNHMVLANGAVKWLRDEILEKNQAQEQEKDLWENIKDFAGKLVLKVMKLYSKLEKPRTGTRNRLVE